MIKTGVTFRYKLLVSLVVAVLVARLVVPATTVKAQTGAEAALGLAVVTNPYYLGLLALVAVTGYVIYDASTDGPISTWFEQSQSWDPATRAWMLSTFASWVITGKFMKMSQVNELMRIYNNLSLQAAVDYQELTIAGKPALEWIQPENGSGVYVDVPDHYHSNDPVFGDVAHVVMAVYFDVLKKNYTDCFNIGVYHMSLDGVTSLKTKEFGSYNSNPTDTWSGMDTAYIWTGTAQNPYEDKVYITTATSSSTGVIAGFAKTARILWSHYRTSDWAGLGNSETTMQVSVINEQVLYPSDVWDGSWSVAPPRSAGDIEGKTLDDVRAGTVPWVQPVASVPADQVIAPDFPIENTVPVDPPTVPVPVDWTGLNNFWAWLAERYNAFLGWLVEKWNVLTAKWDNSASIWTNIWTTLSNLDLRIGLWAVEKWDAFTTLWDTGFVGVLDGISDINLKIGEFVVEQWDAFTTLLTTGFADVITTVGDVAVDVGATAVDIYDWLVAFPDMVVSWFTPTTTVQSRIEGVQALAVNKFPMAVGVILECVTGIFTGGASDLVITLPDGFGGTLNMTLFAPTGTASTILMTVTGFGALLLAVLYLVGLVRRFWGAG